jgi:hypothetical protein
MREMMTRFQNTASFARLNTAVQNAVQNMEETLRASVSNSAQVITGRAAAAQNDDSWFGLVQQYVTTLRTAIAYAGDVIHTGSRSDDIVRISLDAGNEQMRQLFMHLANEFARMVATASTRLQTNLSRDIWGLQWGIGQILFNGGFLVTYYAGVYRDWRRRRTAPIFAEQPHADASDERALVVARPYEPRERRLTRSAPVPRARSQDPPP